jgi:hypothetical protein
MNDEKFISFKYVLKLRSPTNPNEETEIIISKTIRPSSISSIFFQTQECVSRYFISLSGEVSAYEISKKCYIDLLTTLTGKD